MLSIIVAIDEERGIGKSDWLPWDLPEDLALFKKRTLGHSLIMGAKTFLGLPAPLSKRRTFVISEAPLFLHKRVTYVSDLLPFLQQMKDLEEEVFVCGGASIYMQALPYCEKMYISWVKGVHPADTYFPDFSMEEWDVIGEEEYQSFVLKEYRRKNENIRNN